MPAARPLQQSRRNSVEVKDSRTTADPRSVPGWVAGVRGGGWAVGTGDPTDAAQKERPAQPGSTCPPNSRGRGRREWRSHLAKVLCRGCHPVKGRGGGAREWASEIIIPRFCRS